MAANGFNVELLDLYADNFEPALLQVEREAYYAPTPHLTEISRYTDQLSNAEILVLVFPTWWFGFPAILKGWFDRAFAPSVAFDHANNHGPIKPRLVNLKTVLVLTTLGSPWWVDWIVMRRPVRRVMKTAIFGLCAPQAKFKMLSFYSAEKPSPKQLEAFRNRILRHI